MGFRDAIHKMVDRIFPSPEPRQKKSDYWAYTPPWQAGRTITRPKSYADYSAEGYERAVWVNACVKEIGNAVSSVPWVLYRVRGGERKEIDNHEILSILRYPNKVMSGKDLLMAWSIYLNVTGNCFFALTDIRRNGRPKGIFPLRPDRVEIIPDELKYILGYEYKVNNKSFNLQPEEVIHFKFFHPCNDFYGLSPVQVGSSVIDTENYAESWNRNALKNDAVPGGAFVSDSELSDNTRNSLKTEIKSTMQGYESARRPLVLEGGVKWVTMALTAREMDYSNLRKMNRETICALYNVPPILVGILDRSTYSNYEQAVKTFWQDCVIFHLTKFRDKMNMELVPRWGGDLELDYDVSGVTALQESQDSLHRRLRDSVKQGILTINEARQSLGFDPVPWGDTWYAPSNLLPVTAGGTEPEKATSPPPEKKETKEIKTTRRERIADRLRIEEDLTKAYRPKVAKVLEEDGKMIQKGLKAYYLNKVTKKKLLTTIETDSRKRWAKFIPDNEKQMVKEVGDARIKREKSGLPIEQKEFENWFDEAISWIDDYTGMHITEIPETTHTFVETFVSETMEQAIQEGATYREISDLFRGEWESMSDYRSFLIARTESHGAVNAGHYFSGITLGYEEKEWASSGDSRVRPSHRDADGQRRKYDKPFDLPGGQLMFPGDSTLGVSGDEVIGCRCTILEY